MNMNHVTPTHEESFRKKWENYIPQELNQTFNLMLDVVINEARDGMKSPDVQPQPALNPIEQAYERREKIRMKEWPSNLWIMKHTKTEAIDELKNTYDVTNWAMKPHPEKWELYTEPTEQPAKPFDRERFEAMFRAVYQSTTSNFDKCIEYTKENLTKLDAYYAEKEGGYND